MTVSKPHGYLYVLESWQDRGSELAEPPRTRLNAQGEALDAAQTYTAATPIERRTLGCVRDAAIEDLRRNGLGGLAAPI
jgi:hypothetical protein